MVVTSLLKDPELLTKRSAFNTMQTIETKLDAS